MSCVMTLEQIQHDLAALMPTDYVLLRGDFRGFIIAHWDDSGEPVLLLCERNMSPRVVAGVPDNLLEVEAQRLLGSVVSVEDFEYCHYGNPLFKEGDVGCAE